MAIKSAKVVFSEVGMSLPGERRKVLYLPTVEVELIGRKRNISIMLPEKYGLLPQKEKIDVSISAGFLVVGIRDEYLFYTEEGNLTTILQAGEVGVAVDSNFEYVFFQKDGVNTAYDAFGKKAFVEEQKDEDVDESSSGSIGFEFTIGEPEKDELIQTDEYVLESQATRDIRAGLSYYELPDASLLQVKDNEFSPLVDRELCFATASRIVSLLWYYGCGVQSIQATVGFAVTLYEVFLKPDVRISKVKSLENDIILALDAVGVRVICPMPGKCSVGIEVPNENYQSVSAHSVLASRKFQECAQYRLPVVLGRTLNNDVFTFDLADAQHLLIAGATGTGKTVALYDIMLSLLFRKRPSDLQFVLIDPKNVEFSQFSPIAKWFFASIEGTNEENAIVTDCDTAIRTLNSLVKEQENRYTLLMDAGAKNIKEYNEKFSSGLLDTSKEIRAGLHHHYLPYIVTIFDEYGDYIMQSGAAIETPVARVSQLGRGVGLHMILTTQRPSVRIVTGIIKANFPTRIALRTQSVIDSRTIIDARGAEQLIGRGDALCSAGSNEVRIQCAFVEDNEIETIVNHIALQDCSEEHYELPVVNEDICTIESAQAGKKDEFYPILEKVFIENKIYRQPWFENAPSPKELERRTKEELERLIGSPQREITEKDIKRLLRISMSRIAHYKYKA